MVNFVPIQCTCDDNPQNFIILIGLPGAGKTYFASHFLTLPNCIIIERDKLRCDLLWDIRKDDKLKENLLNLDQKVDTAEKDLVELEILQKLHDNIILDGCHTNYLFLLKLITFIKHKNPKINIMLMFIGDENADCYHELTDKVEGDYSDYNEDSSHLAVPLVVYERKQKELKEMIEKYVQILRKKVDSLFFLPQGFY